MAAGVLIMSSLQNVQAIPYMSPQDLYKQSDMVFYGQVISKQTGPGPDYYYYQVKVDTYFKNPQNSDSVTVAGHKPSDARAGYPQFEIGDKAIFYISKLEGINTISPFSTKAGEACDIHAFLGPAPIQGEPIARNPGVPLALLDENGSMVGLSLTNHPVFLTYDIVNNYPFSKNFTLEAFVKDQNDTSITFYKKQVLELGACESTGDALKWSFVPTKSGTYSLNVNIDGQFRLGYGFQVTDAHLSSNPNLQVVSSPLQQFKSGIAANDVKCEQGLQLVIRAEDSSPACVKSQTAQKLVERGWGMISTLALTNNTSENNCGQFYTVPENRSNSNEIPVLILKQNSTGCAKITFTENSLFNNTNDCMGCNSQLVKIAEIIRIGKYNYATGGSSYGISSSVDDTRMFKITSIPDVVDISKYPVGSNFTAIFIIKPLANATGFYDYSIEKMPCNDYPLAVGYNYDQVNSSDFSKALGLMQNHSCLRGGLYGISSVQVSGMSYVQMKLD